MPHCSLNRFCAALDPITRSNLCRVCMKTTFSAGTSITMDFYKHFLILDGLCATQHNRARFPYRPGDFVVTPHPTQGRPVTLAQVSFDESPTPGTKVLFIADTAVAFFDKEKIDEFLQDPGFLAVSYANLKELYAQLVAYFIGMNSSTAYDAVRYLLEYCRHNGIAHLTHEEIAKLTGHSRSTVTSIMHEIALAEPELLQ